MQVRVEMLEVEESVPSKWWWWERGWKKTFKWLGDNSIVVHRRDTNSTLDVCVDGSFTLSMEGNMKCIKYLREQKYLYIRYQKIYLKEENKMKSIRSFTGESTGRIVTIHPTAVA